MVSNKIKKVLFFFDSRATFAYSNNVIKVFKKKNKKFQAIVTGNFLEKKFKIQKNIFKDNKIKISKNINFMSPGSKISSWTISMGKSIIKYSKTLEKLKPDIIVLTGDRIETLSMCLAASYMNIRIAHIQAGDKSGHIDDLSRAAISKFSHLHFAPSRDACKRLSSWGEDRKRIFFTGAPQLEDIKKNKYYFSDSNYFLIIFHPVHNQIINLKKQVLNILKAIKTYPNFKFLWIYPNSDFGHDIILKELKKKKFKNLKIIHNYKRDKFINILSKSRGIIGNSSCGIIEASKLPIPALNIGTRQNGRPQSKNIINSNYETKNIIKAIKKIINNKNTLKLLKKTKNPYYKKNSHLKIFNLIFKFSKNDLIFKKF